MVGLSQSCVHMTMPNIIFLLVVRAKLFIYKTNKCLILKANYRKSINKQQLRRSWEIIPKGKRKFRIEIQREIERNKFFLERWLANIHEYTKNLRNYNWSRGRYLCIYVLFIQIELAMYMKTLQKYVNKLRVKSLKREWYKI